MVTKAIPSALLWRFYQAEVFFMTEPDSRYLFMATRIPQIGGMATVNRRHKGRRIMWTSSGCQRRPVGSKRMTPRPWSGHFIRILQRLQMRGCVLRDIFLALFLLAFTIRFRGWGSVEVLLSFLPEVHLACICVMSAPHTKKKKKNHI